MPTLPKAIACCVPAPAYVFGLFALAIALPLGAQAPSALVAATPIAIVPVGGSAAQAPTVTGALEVTGDRAIIAASGSITSGSRTTNVLLPHRGTLRVCASTTVKLAADTSVAAGDSTPGLLMALDHGAMEMSFATLRNADVLLTPDFRILIGGPGSSEVKVRLGRGGDTCVDNTGASGDKSSPLGGGSAVNAPYIVVTSLFDGGLYRVQPGQRVMFQHGSLHEVVDQEKEPCGCPPPPADAHGNEFPLAQSEGLEPTPAPKPAVRQSSGLTVPPMVYNGADHAAGTAAPAVASASAAVPASAAPPVPTGKKKPGVFARLGHFLRRVFGAED